MGASTMPNYAKGNEGMQMKSVTPIKRLYGLMDPFQFFTFVHSHLSLLSIPIGSGKTPLTQTAASSSVAAPQHSFG